MQSNSTSLVSQLIPFSIKAAIAFILFIVAAVILMPDFTALKYSIKKAAKDEKTRVVLMSFIQNPAALYRASEIDEKAGKFNSAILDMEMAIGLLEMHNASPAVIKRYEARLSDLNKEFKASAPPTIPVPPAALGRAENLQFNGRPVKRWKE